jgi:hypothetical protein
VINHRNNIKNRQTITKGAQEYIYLGDKNTNDQLKGKKCKAVHSGAGKCIRGKNGNMLVVFDSAQEVVVVARLLRKIRS